MSHTTPPPLNTTAHLVARALRDHRTVTWQYAQHCPSGYWQFHGMTRSQILRDVRRTLKANPTGFNYGLTYDASRPPTTNGRYGLSAYVIDPPPPPPPTAAELEAARQADRLAQRTRAAYYLEHAHALLSGTGSIFDRVAAAEVLHTVTFLNARIAKISA